MKAFAAEIIDGRAVPLLAEADVDPVHVEGAEGSIVVVRDGEVEELAPAESAKASLYRVAARNGMDPVFPTAVLDEVREWVREPKIDDPALEDLTHLAFVTIDGKTSRDLDQAVHIETEGEGHVIRYALADASYYVRPGTALFDEALRRGASYYLPGVMIPMLPRALSEGLVSLNPDVERRSLVFTMKLDGEGRCTSTTLSRARIRSRQKLDWGGVQAFYDGGDGFDEAIEANLHGLAEVGRRRMALAEARGVVRYRRSEVVVKLAGREGLRFVVLKDVRRPVERYNEQVSLLCNIEGALLLRDGANGDHVEPIYRVHPPPNDDKLRAFERMLSSMVKSRKLDPDVWAWSSSNGTPIAEYLDRLPTEGEEGRLAQAIHRQAVMVNVRSTFQTVPSGHHGVGAEVYARFSAPMREIVGVYLHAEAWEKLRGEGHRDQALRDAIVVRANEAKQLQRKVTDESNRLVLDQLFAEGGEFVGTVMGLTRGKIHVMLDLPPIDVKVYMRHQQRFAKGELRVSDDESVLRDARGTTLCQLGDEVVVHVRGRDDRKDRWILTVEQR